MQFTVSIFCRVLSYMNYLILSFFCFCLQGLFPLCRQSNALDLLFIHIQSNSDTGFVSYLQLNDEQNSCEGYKAEFPFATEPALRQLITTGFSIGQTKQCSGAGNEPVTSHVYTALLLSLHLPSALMLHFPFQQNSSHFSQLNSSLNLQKCSYLIFVYF